MAWPRRRSRCPGCGVRWPCLRGWLARMKSTHLAAAGVEHHDVVVVAQLADRGEPGLRAVPRVLVVQDHRPPVQRLQLGDVLAAVEDLLVAVDRVVGVVGRQGVGEAARARSRISATVGLTAGSSVAWKRRWRSTSNSTWKIRSSTSPSQVAGSAANSSWMAATLRSASCHGGQHREEHVVAVARHVPPPGRALVVHRHREPVGPEQVQRDVAHQLEAGASSGRPPRSDAGSPFRWGPWPRSRGG